MTFCSLRPLIVLSFVFALGSGCDKSEPPKNDVTMVVTDTGFEPQNFRVKKGEPVTLTITRKVADSCATEIIIDEYKVNASLPENTPVVVTFTPTKSGPLKYGCAMKKMIGGVITVD